MLQQLVADGRCTPQRHGVRGDADAAGVLLEGDDDELAEVALREAALASLRLLAAEGAGGSDPDAACRCGGRCSSRRSTARRLRPDLDDAVVRLAGPVGMADVVAAYLDNAAAEPAVSAAIEVVDSADLGDEDAELTVGDAQDHDLAWYASQELPFLLELL